MVPGVGLSPDRMLQGRVFAYADAHRYRVGTNHQQLPVNAPRSPVNSYQRDGSMAFGSNGAAAPNYEPNSYADAPKQAPQYAEPPLPLNGAADRYDQREDTDYYSHAGALYRLMDDAQKALLVSNIAGAMEGVTSAVVQVQLQHFYKADPAYGEAIAKALGVTLS
jgi:catalase